MGKTIARAMMKPMIAPDDNAAWRPVVTQLDQPQERQSPTRRRSGLERRQQRDMPIDTILNDRLG